MSLSAIAGPAVRESTPRAARSPFRLRGRPVSPRTPSLTPPMPVGDPAPHRSTRPSQTGAPPGSPYVTTTRHREALKFKQARMRLFAWSNATSKAILMPGIAPVNQHGCDGVATNPNGREV
jgi:hypothetical protein